MKDINNVNISLTENGFLIRVASKDAEWYYVETAYNDILKYVELISQDVPTLPKELPKIPEPPKPPIDSKMKSIADRMRL
jgi:hypothetical protein